MKTSKPELQSEVLTNFDRHSSTWIKFEKHMQAQLDTLRKRNDGNLDAYHTAELRGRIAGLKALLAAGQELPVIK